MTQPPRPPDPPTPPPHTPLSHSTRITSAWYERRWAHILRGGLSERFTLKVASPAIMDALWADGWRHFGPEFFKSLFDLNGRRLARVIPLRVDVARATPTRDQRRTLARCEGLEVRVRPAHITPEHEELFALHAERFSRNRPHSLTQFISSEVEVVPCPVAMCEVRDEGGRLLAASYFDIGEEALSSVYAFFEPTSALGLGTLTLLKELAYAQREGKRFVYTGYAHTTPSHYDYKKRLRGTEFFDGARWLPLESLDLSAFERHPFELTDIPLELLTPEGG